MRVRLAQGGFRTFRTSTKKAKKHVFVHLSLYFFVSVLAATEKHNLMFFWWLTITVHVTQLDENIMHMQTNGQTGRHQSLSKPVLHFG